MIPASSTSPSQPLPVADVSPRAPLVRRGLHLNYLTIAYNSFEAVASLAVGIPAGSSALMAFGFDSLIELSASVAAQWRLRADGNSARHEQVEPIARRLVGWSLVALAVYVAYDGASALWRHDAPERSILGIVVLAMSMVVMPLLARAKRRVARALDSRALVIEASQTSLCGYLSAIALVGVFLNAFAGWWWVDPAAALVMVPIIAREGISGVRGEPDDDCCA